LSFGLGEEQKKTYDANHASVSAVASAARQHATQQAQHASSEQGVACGGSVVPERSRVILNERIMMREHSNTMDLRYASSSCASLLLSVIY